MTWRGVVDRCQHSDECQDRARERVRQRGAFRSTELARESAVVAVDQLAEHRNALRIAVARTERRVRVVEREREIVDAGAFAHEVEIEDQHDVVALEPHVVVPEVAMNQLPRQVVVKRELGFGERGRELVGEVGDEEVVGRRVVGADPRRSPARLHASARSASTWFGNGATFAAGGTSMPASTSWIRPRTTIPARSRSPMVMRSPAT